MNKFNLTSIFINIQKELFANSVDQAHDFSHHYRVFVWSNIIQEETNLSVDRYLLFIGTLTHDIFKGKKVNNNMLFKLLNMEIENKLFIDKLCLLINEHTFGKVQTSVESKILYDADKLEYVNPIRLKLFIQSTRDGYIQKETYQKYRKQWYERISHIYKTLNFSFSKSKFLELLPQAEKIMKEEIGLI